MSPVVVGSLVFACALGASLLGMALSAILPKHLLCGDTKDVVRLTMGLVAAMIVAALSVSTSLFLVMEFDGPFDGLIRISKAPVVKALHAVGH